MRPLAFLSLITKGLTSSTTIAAAASVGLHTALGVALPSIPFFSEETFLPEATPGPTRQVAMVELSAQDVSRLPLSVVAPTPALSSLPSRRDFSLPNWDTLPQVSSSTNSSKSSTPKPQAQPRKSPGRAAQLPSAIRSQSRSLPNYSWSGGNNFNASGVNLRTRQQTSGTTSRGTPRRPELSIQPGLRTEPFPIPEPNIPSTEIDNAVGSQSLISARNTTPEEVEANEKKWRSDQPSVEVSLKGVYPDKACGQLHSGTSIYGVTVQPGGNITDLTQLQSAGANILNRAARTQIIGHSFNTVEQPTLAKVAVQFTPDPAVCPELTTAESTTTEPTEQAADEASESTPASSPGLTTDAESSLEATSDEATKTTPGIVPAANPDAIPTLPSVLPAVTPEETPDAPTNDETPAIIPAPPKPTETTADSTDSTSEASPVVLPSPTSTPSSAPAATSTPDSDDTPSADAPELTEESADGSSPDEPSSGPAIVPNLLPRPGSEPTPDVSPSPSSRLRPLPAPPSGPPKLDTTPQLIPYGEGADALEDGE